MVTRLCIALVALIGCIDGSVEPSSTALEVAGTDPGDIEGRDGAIIELDRAELAFGPLTLCAGTSAGDNCDSALAEWRGSVVVNALDPAPAAVGALDGITGTARSYMYDLGFVSLLTQRDPLVLESAEALDGASARIEGQAIVGDVILPFGASVRVAQAADVERGLPVVRSPSDGAFTATLVPAGATLRVTFDPSVWVRDIDFAGLLESAACAPGRVLVCDGMLEQTCTPSGELAATTDCEAQGEVCIRGAGCVPRVDFADESQGASALRQALQSGAPPAFTFSPELTP